MSAVQIVKKCGPEGYAATLAVRLQSLRLAPLEERHQYEGFLRRLLAQQMDFIHALHELPPTHAIEIRYLHDPRRQQGLTVAVLARVAAATKAGARQQAAALESYLLHLLRVNNYLHEFTPVTAKQEFRYLLSPFPCRHLAEIRRREDLVDLESFRALGGKFVPWDGPRGQTQSQPPSPAGDPAAAPSPSPGQWLPSNEKDARVYYVFPPPGQHPVPALHHAPAAAAPGAGEHLSAPLPLAPGR